MKEKIVSMYLCMLLIIPLFSATVSANEPPSTPIIEGETEGQAGEEYEYTFVSTDPDGDDIYHEIEWGCGDTESTDYYPSGETGSASHTYEEGTYIIRVKAIDINEAESDWGTLEVSMPVNIAFNFNFNLLEWLFERFPSAFPILRHLLGL